MEKTLRKVPYQKKDASEMEIKKFFAPFEFKTHDDDEEKGVFEGHAAVFNQPDRMSDIIVPGAFKKSLKKVPANKVKMLREHKTAEMIGVWTEIKEDSKGLFVKGRLLLELQAAQEALVLLKEGVLDSMSIGFQTVVDEFNSKTEVRSLLELNLFEISLVAIPAQAEALVTNVKHVSPEQITTKKDLEKALRNADFSISTSKFIVAGWTPPAPRNGEGGQDELVASLRRATKELKTATGK